MCRSLECSYSYIEVD